MKKKQSNIPSIVPKKKTDEPNNDETTGEGFNCAMYHVSKAIDMIPNCAAKARLKRAYNYENNLYFRDLFQAALDND